MSAKAASWTFDRGDRVGHLESHPSGEAAVQRRNDGWYWRAVYSGDGVQRTGLEKARQAAQNAAEAALCIPPAEPALSLADPTETLALIERGRQEERADLIRWLREAEAYSTPDGSVFPFSQRFLNWRWELADQLSRGDHVSRIRGQQ